MQPLLLDTCAAVWLAEDQRMAQAALDARRRNAPEVTTYISSISAWELGMLVGRDRVKLLIAPQRWFARLFDAPHVRLADMPPDLLIASSFLPGAPPRDPTDRIIAATARDYGATLITRDRALLLYGEQGHINVLAC